MLAQHALFQDIPIFNNFYIQLALLKIKYNVNKYLNMSLKLGKNDEFR